MSGFFQSITAKLNAVTAAIMALFDATNGSDLIGHTSPSGDTTVGAKLRLLENGGFALVKSYAVMPATPVPYELFIVPGTADTVKPVVTGFAATSGTKSPVPITLLTATDNVAVTAYWIGESSAEPALSDSGWSASQVSSYSTTSTGAVTLYARARDAAGNVSAALSQAVTVLATPATAYTNIAWPINATPADMTAHSGGATYFTTGQNVVPSVNTTVKRVEVYLRSHGLPYVTTGTLTLKIRSASYLGPVLATVSIPCPNTGGNLYEISTFVLPAAITLTAATTYCFEFVIESFSGDVVTHIASSATTVYANGSMYYQQGATLGSGPWLALTPGTVFMRLGDA